jgi:hypothetical protein
MPTKWPREMKLDTKEHSECEEYSKRDPWIATAIALETRYLGWGETHDSEMMIIYCLGGPSPGPRGPVAHPVSNVRGCIGTHWPVLGSCSWACITPA